jgi:serine/threonine protein kinase
VEWIEREAVILKTVQHPFIVEFLGYISDPYDNISMIVTEFAGNRTLTNYLPPTEYPLISANNIARILENSFTTI